MSTGFFYLVGQLGYGSRHGTSVFREDAA